MSTASLPIEKHPDLAALRDRYDQTAGRVVTQSNDGALLLAGLYMAASPWIVGFHGMTTLAINDLIAGLAVAALAICFTAGYGRLHGMAFVLPVLGAWMIVSPWAVVGVSTTTGIIVSNVVCGAVVMLFGFGLMGMSLMRMRRGR